VEGDESGDGDPLFTTGVTIPTGPRRGPLLPAHDTRGGDQGATSTTFPAASAASSGSAPNISAPVAPGMTCTPAGVAGASTGTGLLDELCVTCLVRVGRPRATVLRAVVCGPCWAAHGGSPDAEEIGPAPTTTVASADPRDQGHWLSALRRQGWVRDIRADGRANLLAVARLVAWSASWQTLESRPTWERLVARSRLSERTVARWLQELRVRGWLAHLERGSTPAHRPTVLAHLDGNRAAVYGLRIPLTPEEALHRAAEQLVDRLADRADPDTGPVPELTRDAPAQRGMAPVSAAAGLDSNPVASAPSVGASVVAWPAGPGHRDRLDLGQCPLAGEINGSPSWFGFSGKNSGVGGLSRARKPGDNSVHNPSDPRQPPPTALRADLDDRNGPDWATTMPTSRFTMLIAADWLRHRLPVFGRCSRKLLRHLCKPYWQAGWCNRDLVHAMDHRPGLFGQSLGVLICPERIAAPRAFIASRLAAWRTPDGAILPGSWTSRMADVAAARSAQHRVADRYGRAGAALLQPGEGVLTAQHIIDYGQAARPPASPATRAAAQAALAAALATRHTYRPELTVTA